MNQCLEVGVGRGQIFLPNIFISISKNTYIHTYTYYCGIEIKTVVYFLHIFNMRGQEAVTTKLLYTRFLVFVTALKY